MSNTGARRPLRRGVLWIPEIVFAALKLVNATYAIVGHGLLGPQVVAGADSGLYFEIANKSLRSFQFWAAGEPVGYPLLLKLVGSHWRPSIVLQTVISIACWIYLARGINRLVRTPAVGYCLRVVVLLTGLAVSFAIWDVAIASESLALAAFAATVGAACFVVTRPPRPRTHLAVGLLAALVGALARDTNAVLLVVAGVGLVVFVGIQRLRGRRAWRAPVLIGLVVTLAGSGCLALSSHGRRWYWQTVDLTAIRIVGDNTARQYFVAHGMPDDAALGRLHTSYLANVAALDRNDPEYQPFLRWIDRHGRATYDEFLATHPAYLLGKPLSMRSQIAAPNLGQYGTQLAENVHENTVIRGLGALGYAEIPWLRYAVFTIGLVALIWLLVSAERRRRASVRFITVLWLLAVPHALAVYHGDALELARHAITLVLQLQICVVASIALAIDEIIVTSRQASLESARPATFDALDSHPVGSL